MPDSDSVHIIDFKTGTADEDSSSLPFPIYYLLARHCQPRKVTKASYWYLDRDDEPTAVDLPTTEDAMKRVTELAKTIALARKPELLSVKAVPVAAHACRMKRLFPAARRSLAWGNIRRMRTCSKLYDNALSLAVLRNRRTSCENSYNNDR